MSLWQPQPLHRIAQIVIGSVWVFHGVYSKILNGIPRHRLIVGKILGKERAHIATLIIGALEFLLGVWAWTGWQPWWCAQTARQPQTGGFLNQIQASLILTGALVSGSSWTVYKMENVTRESKQNGIPRCTPLFARKAGFYFACARTSSIYTSANIGCS